VGFQSFGGRNSSAYQREGLAKGCSIGHGHLESLQLLARQRSLQYLFTHTKEKTKRPVHDTSYDLKPAFSSTTTSIIPHHAVASLTLPLDVPRSPAAPRMGNSSGKPVVFTDEGKPPNDGHTKDWTLMYSSEPRPLSTAPCRRQGRLWQSPHRRAKGHWLDLCSQVHT
jgi:hypothetical protein